MASDSLPTVRPVGTLWSSVPSKKPTASFHCRIKKRGSRIHCQYAPDYRYVERRTICKCHVYWSASSCLDCPVCKSGRADWKQTSDCCCPSAWVSVLCFHGHNKTDSLPGGEPITCVAGLQRSHSYFSVHIWSLRWPVWTNAAFPWWMDYNGSLLSFGGISIVPCNGLDKLTVRRWKVALMCVYQSTGILFLLSYK